LADHATASGATPEYHILDDFGPLHPIYDPIGNMGDYTARFRPWEGGILADAAYEYLLGNVCDAVQGTLHLAPNLPNGWPWLEARRVRCGETRLDLRVDASVDDWTLTLTHREGPGLEVHLLLPLLGDVTLDGLPWEATAVAYPWDNARSQVSPTTLIDGDEQVFVAER
ncbi:MAG: hypothetical protein QF464_22540, partial [Myxococcota bacterium]|jgi:hypothetical protein|nr:hypothetical protein [Myxococcota bacterium]